MINDKWIHNMRIRREMTKQDDRKETDVNRFALFDCQSFRRFIEHDVSALFSLCQSEGYIFSDSAFVCEIAAAYRDVHGSTVHFLSPPGFFLVNALTV